MITISINKYKQDIFFVKKNSHFNFKPVYYFFLYATTKINKEKFKYFLYRMKNVDICHVTSAIYVFLDK